MDKFRCWFFSILLSASVAHGQDADSLLLPADTTFTSADSLSIFSLIDSLLNMEMTSGSQLAFRLSYNSNVLSAGRTLGIENFGLAPGISYYHRSGLYADLTGYWSKDFEPSYYLTVASLGYMKDFSRRFSVMAGYDRYFYNIDDENSYIPYRNTLSISPILEFKPVSISANYSFYFGDQYAHRIMPGVSYILERKNFLRLDRVALAPSFFVLLGNEIISEIEFVFYKRRFVTVQTDRNVFGIMNYAISIPLSVNYRNLGFSFIYTYNIPKALPGETLTFPESTFLSASLIYFFKPLW